MSYVVSCALLRYHSAWLSLSLYDAYFSASVTAAEFVINYWLSSINKEDVRLGHVVRALPRSLRRKKEYIS